MSDTTNNYTLMGFFEALSLIFVIAKILGYINWPWLWVFAPVLIHIGIILGFIALIIAGVIIKFVLR